MSNENEKDEKELEKRMQKKRLKEKGTNSHLMSFPLLSLSLYLGKEDGEVGFEPGCLQGTMLGMVN